MRFVITPVVLAAFAVPAWAAGPYEDLLKYVPPESNTLLLLNVQAAYNTPLAKSEKWSESVYHRYKSGIGFIPPDGTRLVIGSYVNLSNMTRDHQVGLVKVTGFPTIKGLAAREGGSTDRIRDQGVALSPRNMYLTTLAGPAIAAVFPADRQATSRWLKHASQAKKDQLAPYLKKAADEAGDSILTIAVDLTDSVDPTLLAMGLAVSPVVVKEKGTNVNRLATFVASVRGLTFSTKVTDKTTGTIRIDFAFEIAAHKKIAHDLFLELLGDQGVAIPGMEKWEATYTNTSMTLTGPLTTNDARGIISLLAFPGVGAPAEAKAVAGEVNGPATKRYIAAVDAILTGLGGKKDSKDYLKTATWHDKAAMQLEQLSRVGVDSIASDAASSVAKRIRAMAATLRGVPVDLKAIDSSAYYRSHSSVGVSFGWWGGFRPYFTYYPGGGGVQTNYPQVQAERAKTIANSEKNRIELSSQITNIMVEAKRKLSDKYKLPY